MNHRLIRKWTLWLLPLLAARALLPVGFMLSANADGLALVFCAGQATALVQGLKAGATPGHGAHGVEHSQHEAQYAQGVASEHVSHENQLDQPCPFALAAMAIATVVPHPHADSQRLTDESTEPGAQWPSRAGPLRADRIRGPPSFS